MQLQLLLCIQVLRELQQHLGGDRCLESQMVKEFSMVVGGINPISRQETRTTMLETLDHLDLRIDQGACEWHTVVSGWDESYLPGGLRHFLWPLCDNELMKLVQISCCKPTTGTSLANPRELWKDEAHHKILTIAKSDSEVLIDRFQLLSRPSQ